MQVSRPRAELTLVVRKMFHAAALGVGVVFGGALLLRGGFALAGVRLLRNVSPSLPLGLYLTRPLGPVTPGQTVCVRAADAAAPPALRAAALGGRDGGSWRREPLIKLVAAVAGDRVTYEGDQVCVNGRPLAHSTMRSIDREGIRLPHPTYPLVIAPGEVWLASRHPDGFDSRYFGAASIRALDCQATPLWLW